MTGLINPRVRSVLGVHKQGALSVSSKDKIDISTQPINEFSIQGPKAEKPQPKPSEILTTENQSQQSANSQLIPSAPLIPKVKATSSAFIEKYEMGSGKDKINVCIFKEPPAEPVTLEPQKDANTKQTEADTLVLRLQEELTATPIQPSEPNDAMEKVMLEE